MNYILCLGFKSILYKQPPNLRISINNFFVDEFEISNNVNSDITDNNVWSEEIRSWIKKTNSNLLSNTVSISDAIDNLKNVKNFYADNVFFKFYELSADTFNKDKENCLNIEIYSNDNNYTNGFITKSTMVSLSVAQILPKEVLYEYKNLLLKHDKKVNNLKKTHMSINEIKEHYNFKEYLFDLINGHTKNEYIDTATNVIKNISFPEFIGGEGYLKIYFQHKLIHLDEHTSIENKWLQCLPLHALANKYTQYENQRSNNS